MAFQARVRAWLAKLAEIANSLKDGRLSAASRTKLQAEMKAVKAKKPSHFEHLEVATAYHIIQGYNSTRPEALHLNDVKQWHQALEAGPLTNAKRGGKPKGKRPARATNAASASGASADPPKRIRGTTFSRQADGDVAWPPSRLVGKHRLGWHETGTKNTHCDYPLCNEVEKTCTRAPSSSADASTPRRAAMPPPYPRSRAPGSATSADSSRARTPSPAPSDTSSTCSTASMRGSVAKMFCRDCYDASNSRPMSLHAECWNLWHGLCDACVDACVYHGTSASHPSPPTGAG